MPGMSLLSWVIAALCEATVSIAQRCKDTFPAAETDSAPKTYTLREQIIFGIKLAAVGVIFFNALAVRKW